MSQTERDKSAFVDELKRRLRKRPELLNMLVELAQAQGPVSTLINDTNRFPIPVGRGNRVDTFRETFAAMRLEHSTADTTGKGPVAA